LARKMGTTTAASVEDGWGAALDGDDFGVEQQQLQRALGEKGGRRTAREGGPLSAGVGFAARQRRRDGAAPFGAEEAARGSGSRVADRWSRGGAAQ
jgi:hypothetical protein